MNGMMSLEYLVRTPSVASQQYCRRSLILCFQTMAWNVYLCEPLSMKFINLTEYVFLLAKDEIGWDPVGRTTVSTLSWVGSLFTATTASASPIFLTDSRLMLKTVNRRPVSSLADFKSSTVCINSAKYSLNADFSSTLEAL